MRTTLVCLAILVIAGPVAPAAATPPSIVLVMTDDQGWGDVEGRTDDLHMPNLATLTREGVEFTRFYAAAPVCSPTRASVLTGRHPARMGIDGANTGHLPHDELTLTELLHAAGYRTGFFGKWHLGTLTREVKDSNRGGRPAQTAHYSPPWEHGFDVSVATEAKVPTFDPMIHPTTGASYGTRYWTDPGEVVDAAELNGDDSAIIVDRAIEFLDATMQAGRPAFVVIWLHAPHEPVVRHPDQLAALDLDPHDERDRYIACLADIDEQLGRLRDTLRDAPAVLFYCSDNGPEHRTGPGSTGGLRGRKRDLYDGGIRVPGILWWSRVMDPPLTDQPRGSRIETPASTVDILPTMLDVAGLPLRLTNLDGASLARPRPVDRAYAFRSGRQRALIRNRWKLHSGDGGATWALYDLVADPAERTDRAAALPDRVHAMMASFRRWEEAVIRDRDEHRGR